MMDGLRPADQDRVFRFASQYLDNPKDFSSCATVCRRWNAMLNLESGSGEKGLAFRAQKLVVEKYLQEHLQVKPEIASVLIAMKPKEWSHIRFASELKTQSKPLPHPQPLMTPEQLTELKERMTSHSSCLLKGLTLFAAGGTVISLVLGYAQGMPLYMVSCYVGALASLLPAILDQTEGRYQRTEHSIWLPDRKSAAGRQLTFGLWREQLALWMLFASAIVLTRHEEKLVSKIPYLSFTCTVGYSLINYWLFSQKLIPRLGDLFWSRGEDGHRFPPGWCTEDTVWSQISDLRGYRLDLDARYCLMFVDSTSNGLTAERLYWIQDFVQCMNWDRESEEQRYILRWLLNPLLNNLSPVDGYNVLQITRSGEQGSKSVEYPADLFESVEWLREKGRHRVEDVYANPLVFQE